MGKSEKEAGKDYHFKIGDLDKMDPEISTRVLLLYTNDALKGENGIEDFTLDIFSLPIPQFYWIESQFTEGSIYGALHAKIGIKSYTGGLDSVMHISIIKASPENETSYSVQYRILVNGATKVMAFQEIPRDCWGSFNVNTNSDGHILIGKKYYTIPGGIKRVYTDFLQALFVNEFSQYKKDILVSGASSVEKFGFNKKECKRLMYNFEEYLNKK